MTVKAMSATQIARFAKSMEVQGVGVTRTKKGLLLRLPNGESTMLHFTASDVRAITNLKARLRRAGVNHPDDTRAVELPDYITAGSVREKSKKLAWQWVRDHDFPDEVHGKDFAELGWDPGQCNRVLYHAGFVPSDRVGKKGRSWAVPEWLAEEGVALHRTQAEAALAAAVEGAREAGRTIGRELLAEDEESPTFPESEVVTTQAVHTIQTNGREFIDSVDSWVVDLVRLPMNMTIGEYFQSLDASGIDFEIRMWRRV